MEMEGVIAGGSRCWEDGEDAGELEVVARGGDDVKDGVNVVEVEVDAGGGGGRRRKMMIAGGGGSHRKISS